MTQGAFVVRFVFLALFVVASCFATASAKDAPRRNKHYRIGTDLYIDLPKEWKIKRHRMPDIFDQTIIHITGSDLHMSIILFPRKDEYSAPMTLGDRKSSVRTILALYEPASKERKVEPMEFSTGAISGAYGTLSSATGNPTFQAFGGATWACMTIASAHAPRAGLTIQIASSSCSGEAHQAALEAVLGMQESGDALKASDRTAVNLTDSYLSALYRVRGAIESTEQIERACAEMSPANAHQNAAAYREWQALHAPVIIEIEERYTEAVSEMSHGDQAKRLEILKEDHAAQEQLKSMVYSRLRAQPQDVVDASCSRYPRHWESGRGNFEVDNSDDIATLRRTRSPSSPD